MKVSSTIFAENLLCSHNLSCDAVCMLILVLAFAGIDESRMDSQEFEVQFLLVEVVFEVLKKWGKMSFRHTFDHIVSVNDKDRPVSCAKITCMFLFISFIQLLLYYLNLILYRILIIFQVIIIFIILSKNLFKHFLFTINRTFLFYIRFLFFCLF